MGLLNLAEMLGSVSEACKVMGYSRDSWYRFKELYEVIQHDMNLSGRGILLYDVAEKADTFGAGVAAGGFSLDLAGLHIQRRVKGERTVS